MNKRIAPGQESLRLIHPPTDDLPSAQEPENPFAVLPKEMRADAYRIWGAYKMIMPCPVAMVVCIDSYVRHGLTADAFAIIATTMRSPQQMMKHRYPNDAIVEMSRMAAQVVARNQTIQEMLARRTSTAAPPEKFREVVDALRVMFPGPHNAKGERDARK